MKKNQKKNNQKTIVFDFDGVLCDKRLFYCQESEKIPDLLQNIDNLIFRGDHVLIDKWMRGEHDYKSIISIIDEVLGYSKGDVETFLFESIRMFEIKNEFKPLLKKLSKKKHKLILVTNNVDIFDKIAENCNLKDYFEVIVKSTEVGCLKHENDGLLYDFALKKAGVNNYSDCLLIDDSEKACNMFQKKGGSIIKFVDFNKLLEQLDVLLYNCQ